MTDTPNHRIEAPAPITTPIRLPGDIPADQLVEFPAKLDIVSVERSGPTRDNPELPPVITLYCGDYQLLMVGGHSVSVSDERGEVKGWGIYPISRTLGVLWDQMIGSAIPPEGDSAECWLDCWDVFAIEAIEVIHELLAGSDPAGAS